MRPADETMAAEELEQRVALIREHMTDVVSELDYRRHELLDVKKHAGLLAAIGGGMLLLAGGLIGFSVYRSRKAKEEQRRRFFAPRVIRQYESVWHKVLSAGAGALATIAVKAVATELMKPALESGSRQPPALPDYD